MYIVIRAGGAGSRLWPVSRKQSPKQFHAFTSNRTMLQEAVDRVGDLAPLDRVFISTGAATADLAQSQCPNIPQSNIIIEPARKDTAAAVGLESVILAHQDPEAIVASLGSDHSVRNAVEFQKVLRAAERFIQENPETIVPIGIQPLHPDTGYGYIECGETVATIDGEEVYSVVRFTEKPDLATAQSFIADGGFLWNANMFVWKVSTILDLYKKHLPTMYEQLMVIAQSIGTPQQQEVIDRVYPELERIAIDYAIIEKAHSIASIPANIGWNDIGDWSRLKDELAADARENIAMNADHIAVDTYNTLVYREGTKKVVATIGLDDMVIVDTPDALFVAKKTRTQDVKAIVEDLEKQQKDNLL